VVDVGEGLANFWPLGSVSRSVVVYVRPYNVLLIRA
jgi:hypothetical protein